MAQVEHNEQARCVAWFRLQYRDLAPLLFAVPNAARRTRWEVAQLKQEGMVAGVSDLVLLVPRGGYGALCIEMKKEQEEWKAGKRTLKRGYQSPAQKAWQAAAEQAGNKYVVCHSLDEFQRDVNRYLALAK